MNAHRKATDGGYGWVVVICGFFLSAFEAGTIKSFGVFLAVIIDDLDTSQGVVGLAFGLCGGLNYLLGFVWSMVYVPNRMFLFVASILVTVSLALCSVCYNAVQLTFISITAGMAYSVWPFWITMALQGYFPKQFSLAFGLTTAGRALGMITIPIIAEKLLEIYGWRGAILILAGVNFHSMIASAFSRTLEEQGTRKANAVHPGSRMKQKQNGRTDANGIHCHSKGSTKRTYESIELVRPSEETGSSQSTCTNQQTSNALSFILERLSPTCRMFKEYVVLIPLLVSCLMLGITMTGLIIFLVPYSVDRGIKLSLATILSGIFGLGDLIGRPLIGFIHTKTQWSSLKLLLGITLLSSATFFLFPLSYSFSILAAAAFFSGAFLGAISVLIAVVMCDALPKELFRKALGLYSLSYGIGAPLGGLIAGEYKVFTSSYEYAFIFFGTLEILASLVLIIAIKLDSKKRQKMDHVDGIPLIGSDSNTE